MADAATSGGVNHPDLELPTDLPFGQPSSRLSREELGESLLFYRRRLAAKLAVALIEYGAVGPTLAHDAEDIANAICERLAARETGDPRGYKAD